MCDVGKKSESFCTYVPTYQMRLIFYLGDWFPSAFFNKRDSLAYCYTLLKTTICY